MGKVLGVVFSCAILFWVMGFLTPTSQRERINNFCSPFTYPVKIIGAAVSGINEDGGQSITQEGAEATDDYCRDFAPRLLKIIGADGNADSTVIGPEILQDLEEKKRQLSEQIKLLDSEEAKQHFSEEQIYKMKNQLLEQYLELEERLKVKTKPSVSGISEEDRL